MSVQLSPRHREKILEFLLEEEWVTVREKSTIREIAQVMGMMQSACEFFHWGLAQLLVVQTGLCIAIKKGYKAARASNRVYQQIINITRSLPKTMQYRLCFLPEQQYAHYLWSSKVQITITEAVRTALRRIYQYLQSRKPWETPIVHIIDRDYACISTQDASHHALAVQIPNRKVWMLLPFSQRIFNRIKKDEEIHINVLEFLALFIGFVMFQEEHKHFPTEFPPAPTMISLGDNMSANSWVQKINTPSIMGQNALQLFAEYNIGFDVAMSMDNISSKANIIADTISRVNELFVPKKSHIYDVPFSILVTQVCSKYTEMKSWKIFLPSRKFLSDLNLVLLSKYSTVAQKEI